MPNDRDKESLESDQKREERQKPTVNTYNEEANGGRWWEKGAGKND